MKYLKDLFSHLIEPNFLVVFLLILAFCIALTLLFSKKLPEFKKYKINLYFYLFFIIFIFTIMAFLGYNRVFFSEISSEFIFYQLCCLVLGSVHCYLYRTLFQKFKNEKQEIEYFFVFLTSLYGILPFLFIYTLLNGLAFNFLILGCFLLFFIPTLLNHTFNLSILIPPKLYITWKFPPNYQELIGVNDEEMRDLVVITFYIQKNENDEDFSSFRAKGPVRMDFGRLFYNFIADYNARFENNPIAIENKQGAPYEWIFFTPTKWYASAKYIDPNYTLHMNGIQENSIVYCLRASTTLQEEEEEQENDFEF